jgi:hypothetical protein
MSNESQKTDEKPTNPGKNGVRLKADAGPGRPKGMKNWKTCIADVMNALPDRVVNEADILEAGIKIDKKMTVRDVIVISQVKAALAGDTRAAQFLADREDGKPQQAIELSGDQDKPVLIINRFNGNSNK